MISLKRRTVSKEAYSKREVSAAEFIPYHYHWDKETIITKNRELMKIIKIDGFSFETADDEDVDMKKMVRNSLFKSMADGSFAVWFHIIRRRQSVFPGGSFTEGFGSEVNDAWYKKHHSKDSYVNDLYITVIRKADKSGAAKLEHYFNLLTEKADKGARDDAIKEAHKELTEAIYRVVATFKDYGARVLTVQNTDMGAFSEPLGFLSKLVNCDVRSHNVRVPTMDISHYLSSNRLYFGSRAIEVRTPTYKRYAGVVSVKEYPPATAAGMLDAFLQLPFEFIIAQSFVFQNRQDSIQSMQIKQRRMINAEDVAITQVAEISDVLDMTMGGHIAIGYHHLSVLCIEDSLKALEDSVSMALAEMINTGINPVREKMFMEQVFWAQLPGNFDIVGRKARIHTLNLAGFASLHNYPVGKMAGNHWGDAVTVFDTSSGTPYFFNFHLRDVGHTTIIGPTGAGKTVLMNFLAAQAQKFKCRMFFFDKDRGADIFLRALGGSYTVIEPGEKCGFNPLQLPDTLENRNFLCEWMKTLVTTNDEPFTAEDTARIQEAVAGNFKLAKKDRVLRNIAPFLGFAGPGTIAGRLSMWHSGGQYSGLFDNDVDIVDFGASHLFGFEMGEVLADATSLAPTLLYLFHRIHLSLDGTPTMIILDEAWALLDNKTFASKIKDWLKTLRKLNGMVVFATQSVEDATSSSISDTLIQQTATQIFLPNPKATDTYKSAFMLSDREFNLLKTTDPGSRFFLVKQGKDVVVARIDLSGMEDVVNVLSGRAETVSVCDEVRAQLGEDPAVWLPVYQEKVRKHGKK